MAATQEQVLAFAVYEIRLDLPPLAVPVITDKARG